MLTSYQSKLLSKAAATLHFCSVVVVFFVQCLGNGRAAESVHDSRKSLQCQIVARAVFPEIILECKSSQSPPTPNFCIFIAAPPRSGQASAALHS